MACGLITTSGIMPDAVYGKSHGSINFPITPFCEYRDANLSPTFGTLVEVTTREVLSYVFNPSFLSLLTTRDTVPSLSAYTLSTGWFSLSRKTDMLTVSL